MKNGWGYHYKLYLDDERFPPADDPSWKIARNYFDAVFYVRNYGIPEVISFDHDLGNFNETGMEFAKWFCNYILDNEIQKPGDFQYYVHSMNPVGAKNIQSYMDQFVKDYW